MSTVSDRPARIPPREPDPFRYGWRYVRIVRPDGTEGLDQVPLTLEDVLHPEVGDFIVQSDPHDSDRAYLKAVSKARLAGESTTVVLSDCRIDFNIPGVKPLGPDVAVFTGVRRRIMWSTFDVAREGARPVLVIEVTSPDTRSNDVGIKVDYYFRGRVAWYLIADVTIEEEGERRIELILYHRVGRTYRLVPVDDRGWVWLEPVGLWLGQTRDAQGGFMRLACYDPATGEEVGDYTAISRALAESQKKLAEESRARKRAERRAQSEAKARARAERARAEAEGPERKPSSGHSPRSAPASRPRPRSAPSRPSSSGRAGRNRDSRSTIAVTAAGRSGDGSCPPTRVDSAGSPASRGICRHDAARADPAMTRMEGIARANRARLPTLANPAAGPRAAVGCKVAAGGVSHGFPAGMGESVLRRGDFHRPSGFPACGRVARKRWRGSNTCLVGPVRRIMSAVVALEPGSRERSRDRPGCHPRQEAR